MKSTILTIISGLVLIGCSASSTAVKEGSNISEKPDWIFLGKLYLNSLQQKEQRFQPVLSYCQESFIMKIHIIFRS